MRQQRGRIRSPLGDPLAVHSRVPRDRHHPRIYDPPTPLDRALEQVACWLELPTLVLLSETARHWPSLRELLEASRTAGSHIHDARIAALCRQHGVDELWTADRGFGRFAGLRFRNPLVSPA